MRRSNTIRPSPLTNGSDGHSLAPPVADGLLSSGSSVFDFPSAREPVSTDPTPISNFMPGPETGGANASVSYVVLSGGTGCNGIVSAFGSNVVYVLPVSDNGGSSSEIIRVLGGPSIGDIRSRLIRLIPESTPSSPVEAIRRLLSHRFPANCTEREVRDEWRDIVEGRSPLWIGIPPDRKETIRGFLVYFEGELLRRASKSFSFKNGSIGNYFISAAHLFFRSVPSAIFLFSSITGSQAHILPVLVTNHTVTIAAELEDGSKIVGQCEISHPVQRDPNLPQIVGPDGQRRDTYPYDDEDDDAEDDAEGVPSSKEQNALFSKGPDSSAEELLNSRIRRVYYINPYGQEVFPKPNPEFVAELGSRDVLVYSIGSLWTSIIPCLALQGVASAIARSPCLRAKVFLLNGCNDRETGHYTAVDYVQAICNTLNRHDQQGRNRRVPSPEFPVSAFITHLVYLRGTSIEVDELALTALGVKCLQITPRKGVSGKALYYADDVRDALATIVSKDPDTPLS